MNPGTDDRQSAVALSYLDKTRAPVVVAKGYGVAAESIMREARENGLYVHASPALNKLLMQVDLDQPDPAAAVPGGGRSHGLDPSAGGGRAAAVDMTP